MDAPELLAAVGSTMAVLADLIHGHLEPFVTADAGIPSGLAAYLAFLLQKLLQLIVLRRFALVSGVCRNTDGTA
jgi:hypothetical protein